MIDLSITSVHNIHDPNLIIRILNKIDLVSIDNIHNMLVPNPIDLESVYGIVPLRHGILTESALAEGIQTECRVTIVTEAATLSVKSSAIVSIQHVRIWDATC